MSARKPNPPTSPSKKSEKSLPTKGPSDPSSSTVKAEPPCSPTNEANKTPGESSSSCSTHQIPSHASNSQTPRVNLSGTPTGLEPSIIEALGVSPEEARKWRVDQTSHPSYTIYMSPQAAANMSETDVFRSEILFTKGGMSVIKIRERAVKKEGADCVVKKEGKGSDASA